MLQYPYDTYLKIKTNDPDLNPVKFFIDWGDGSTEWTNDFASGENVYISHHYQKIDNYKIKTKAQDTSGAESGYGKFKVRIQNSKIINRLYLQFLQNHSNLVSIIKRLLTLK